MSLKGMLSGTSAADGGKSYRKTLWWQMVASEVIRHDNAKHVLRNTPVWE